MILKVEETMKKKPDQTKNTKEKLENAFWKLYEQKPFEHITVREITQLAGYNRSTFYTYYKDVYDVLEQTEEEILQMFADGYEGKGYICDENQIKESLSFLGAFLKKNHNRLALLVGENGDVKFALRLLHQMRDGMRRCLSGFGKADDKSFEYIVEYMVNAHVGLAVRWFQNGCDIPFERIVELINQLMLGGVVTVLKGEKTTLEEIVKHFDELNKSM